MMTAPRRNLCLVRGREKKGEISPRGSAVLGVEANPSSTIDETAGGIQETAAVGQEDEARHELRINSLLII